MQAIIEDGRLSSSCTSGSDRSRVTLGNEQGSIASRFLGASKAMAEPLQQAADIHPTIRLEFHPGAPTRG